MSKLNEDWDPALDDLSFEDELALYDAPYIPGEETDWAAYGNDEDEMIDDMPIDDFEYDAVGDIESDYHPLFEAQVLSIFKDNKPLTRVNPGSEQDIDQALGILARNPGSIMKPIQESKLSEGIFSSVKPKVGTVTGRIFKVIDRTGKAVEAVFTNLKNEVDRYNNKTKIGLNFAKGEFSGGDKEATEKAIRYVMSRPGTFITCAQNSAGRVVESIKEYEEYLLRENLKDTIFGKEDWHGDRDWGRTKRRFKAAVASGKNPVDKFLKGAGRVGHELLGGDMWDDMSEYIDDYIEGRGPYAYDPKYTAESQRKHRVWELKDSLGKRAGDWKEPKLVPIENAKLTEAFEEDKIFDLAYGYWENEPQMGHDGIAVAISDEFPEEDFQLIYNIVDDARLAVARPIREGGPRKNIDYEGIAHQFCLIKDPVARQAACDKLFDLIKSKNTETAEKEAKKAMKAANKAQVAATAAQQTLTERKLNEMTAKCDCCNKAFSSKDGGITTTVYDSYIGSERPVDFCESCTVDILGDEYWNLDEDEIRRIVEDEYFE